MRLTQSSRTSLATLQGSQVPSFQVLPDGATQRGEVAVRFSSLFGVNLDPWQEHVLSGSMRQRADGKWSAFEVGLVVPRQQGKSAVLEARAVVGLFAVPDEKIIIWSAHLFKTAQEAFRRILRLIEDTPQLKAKLKKVSTAHGSEGIELDDGSRILFMARHGGSARGFSADLIILDEAYDLSSDEMAALLPTVAAKSIAGNPQLFYASSAGLPQSEVLADLRERARGGGSTRLAYFEWAFDDEVDLDDESALVDAIVTANPGLGIRMSLEHALSEKESMQPEQYKRERLGQWARLGGESVFPAGAWAALEDESSTAGDRLVFAVEIAGNRDSASIMAVSVRDDGKIHVEVVDNREGTSWLGHRLKELQASHSPEAIWAIGNSHVDAMTPSWKRDGVRVKLMRFPEYVKACGLFFSKVVDGEIRHLGDPILDDAVSGVQQKWTQDKAAFYWSRKDSSVDITTLVAATVGVGVLEKRKPRAAGEKRKAVIL